jgi:hypothetical protein
MDIKFPNIIFNINNEYYTNSIYSYGVNAYFDIILNNNTYLVSNVDYVSDNINYNYFNKIAFYDNIGTYYGDYGNTYRNIYPGTSLIFQLDKLFKSNGLNSVDFKKYTQKYGFNMAYYIFSKYARSTRLSKNDDVSYFLFENILNDPVESNYYIYNVDLLNSTTGYLRKPDSVLNNKMPLVYYNNNIIYVNNDTYSMGLYTVYMGDIFTSTTGEMYYTKLQPPPLLGKSTKSVSDNVELTATLIANSYYIYYTIGVEPTDIELFDAAGFTGELNMFIDGEKYLVVNNSISYVGYEASTNLYYYKIRVNYGTEYGTFAIGNTVYDSEFLISAIVKEIRFSLVIKDVLDPTLLKSGEIIRIVLDTNNIITAKLIIDASQDSVLKNIYSMDVSITQSENKLESLMKFMIFGPYPFTPETVSDLVTLISTKGERWEYNVVMADMGFNGHFYSINYTPINYISYFEKSLDFPNIHYLQTDNSTVSNSIAAKSINFITSAPVKANQHNLETYNMYPIYNIKLNNGNYNETTLLAEMENKLNTIQYKEYNYFKKEFIETNLAKNILNNPDYTLPVFKTNYNPTNREFTLSRYNKTNRNRYTAYYNRLNPFIFFNQHNTIIQNNERVFFDVVKINNTAYSEIANNAFRKEVTTRVMPTYTYSLRLMSPVAETENKYKQITNSIDALLEEIKLTPFEVKNRLINLTTKLNKMGEALINIYNNSYSFDTTTGTIKNNNGFPNPLDKFELCICINNIYFTHESYKIGRVCKIFDQTANEQGNFRVRFQMTGETEQSFPFTMGDILYSLDSRCYFCVVPNEWGMYMEYPEIARIHNTLPTRDIIRSGYLNYITLLASITGKLFLSEIISQYNLSSVSQYQNQNVNNTLSNQISGYPWEIWFIQEEHNAHYGFEIYFENNTNFQFNQDDINLEFLRSDSFTMFLNSDKKNSPKDILGVSDNNVLNVTDYQNNNTILPTYHSLSNTYYVNTKNIVNLYLVYSSINTMINKIYLAVDNVSGFNIGDEVFINDLTVFPIFMRNLFNIYQTNNHSIKQFINVDIYLSTIIYRLAFIKLGIAIPNGPNDVSRTISNNNYASLDEMMTTINNLNLGETNYIENYIKKNYNTELVGNICNNLGVLINNRNITSSEIYESVRQIRNVFLFNNFVPWFNNQENIQYITRGDQYAYTKLYSKYFDWQNGTQNIWRLELKITNDLFIFYPNMNIYDSYNNKIGTILDFTLYPEHLSETGLVYHIYIVKDSGYTDPDGLFQNQQLDENTNKLYRNTPYDVGPPSTWNYQIFSDIYNTTQRHQNRLNFYPIYIDRSYSIFSGLYFYETYMRYKITVLANPILEDTYNNVLNFNLPDNITSTFSNLFNIENSQLDVFKPGYNVYIGPSANFQDEQLFGESYRIITSFLDDKNIYALCEELGLITGTEIEQMRLIIENMVKSKRLNEYITNVQGNISRINALDQSVNDYNAQVKNMTQIITTLSSNYSSDTTLTSSVLDILANLDFSKNNITDILSEISGLLPQAELTKRELKLAETELIKIYQKYSDILQLLTDFQVQHTFAIDKDWNNELELANLDSFKYTARRMDMSFLLLGNNNYTISKFGYAKEFVYGKKDLKTGDDYSNVNLFFYNFFKSIYSDDRVYKANTSSPETVSTELCNWGNLLKISKLDDQQFNTKLQLYDSTNILNGIVWVGTYNDKKTSMNSKTIWVIFPKLVYFMPDGSTQNLLTNWANFRNYLITINFINVDQNKSYNVDSIEYNQYVDNNIIELFEPILDSAELDLTLGDLYHIFKVNLKFPPKYAISRGTPIGIRDYYTTLYKSIDLYDNNKIRKTNYIYLEKNWNNTDTSIQFELQTNVAIHINMGSNNSMYSSYINKQRDFSATLNSYETDDYLSEDILTIESIDPDPVTINNKIYIKCILSRPIKYEFASGLPVIIRYAPVLYGDNNTYSPIRMNNQNTINVNLLTTEPFLVNSEWYTKLYYNNSNNMDIFGVSGGGMSAFKANSGKKIFVSGMRGYVQPNIGFQKEERTYIYNSATKMDEQQNKYIKPVPDGKYSLEYYQREDGLDFMEDSVYITKNLGYYKPTYNMNMPEQDDEWIDNYMNYMEFKKCVFSDSTVDVDNSNLTKLPQAIYNTLDNSFLGNLYQITKDTDGTFTIIIELNIIYNKYPFGYQDIVFSTPFWGFSCYIPVSTDYVSAPIINNNYINYDYSGTIEKEESNYVVIKGKYLGYGGYILIINENDIFNQISYKISDVNKDYNYLELDLESTHELYSFYYRNNNFMDKTDITNSYFNNINYRHPPVLKQQINPAWSNFQEMNEYDTSGTSQYSIIPVKYEYLSKAATVSKKQINKPLNTDVLDYIIMCVNNIDGNYVVEQQNMIDNKIMLAKIYINKSTNNYDIQIRDYEVVFDMRLLPSIDELDIIFLDKTGNLINFNGLDNNFTLEVSQYVEKVRNIDTKNGMVY